MRSGNLERELFWELRDDEEQRAHRVAMLRAMYALVDPGGWDARRLAAEEATLHVA